MKKVYYGEEERSLKEREYLICDLAKIDEKTFETRLTISKLIGSSLENEELIYSNSIEILSYGNSEGRRMIWADGTNIIDKDKNIPGNFIPSILDVELDYMDNIKDTAVAEDVFIIPPFGKRSNLFINLNKYIEQKTNFLNKEDIIK